VVRIRRSHRRGRGSIPRLGEKLLLLLYFYNFIYIVVHNDHVFN
jgi:hypothetical protein